MPHGQPDWGAFSQKSTVGGLSDMAELAVRLGSPDTFDRMGTIIWMDDFERGIHKWFPVIPGVGAAIEWVAGTARTGGFSAKLTHGNVIGDTTIIRRLSPLPVSSRLGFEFSFTMEDDLEFLYVAAGIYTGAIHYVVELRYYPLTDLLQYLGDDFLYHTFATNLALLEDIHMFHNLKLVIDLVGEEYVRCVVNSVAHDLSGILMYQVGSLIVPQVVVETGIQARIAANRFIYLDTIILTQNEP